MDEILNFTGDYLNLMKPNILLYVRYTYDIHDLDMPRRGNVLTMYIILI